MRMVIVLFLEVLDDYLDIGRSLPRKEQVTAVLRHYSKSAISLFASQVKRGKPSPRRSRVNIRSRLDEHLGGLAAINLGCSMERGNTALEST